MGFDFADVSLLRDIEVACQVVLLAVGCFAAFAGTTLVALAIDWQAAARGLARMGGWRKLTDS